jgi:diaminopimelate decarboxylase
MDVYDPRARLALFPDWSELEPPEPGPLAASRKAGEAGLTIAGCDLGALAQHHGTPLYLYDQATMDAAVAEYRQALKRFYPGPAGITYAGKAFLCVAMAQWVQRKGLWLDCTGVGELYVAAKAGVRREQIVVHGVNKTQEDVDAALVQAGTIVVDSLGEVEKLARWSQRGSTRALPNLWLRVRPGLAVATHAHTQTGQKDSKFGMGWQEATEAIRLCLQHTLPVTGLHFHQGSHFHDPQPLGPAIDSTLDLVAALHAECDWLPQVVCPGGGWGVAYHQDELPHPPVAAYVRYIGERLSTGCHKRGLPLPQLHLEPGRSIVGRAGVALYRVGAVKHASGRRWLLLDGGLADNPRRALYGARYSALPVEEPLRQGSGPAWLGGPYCESGDILMEELALPDVQAGELIAVPVSGAYQLSMASNYNGARKPAVLWLVQGEAHLVQERESLDDLVRRDRALPR